jgi:hypothetical protein
MGASLPAGSIAFYSNYDSNLIDFYAQGTTVLYGLDGKKTNFAGTSASVLVGATSWATVKSVKPNLNYTELYDLISKTSRVTKSSRVPSGKLIDLAKAIG